MVYVLVFPSFFLFPHIHFLFLLISLGWVTFLSQFVSFLIFLILSSNAVTILGIANLLLYSAFEFSSVCFILLSWILIAPVFGVPNLISCNVLSSCRTPSCPRPRPPSNQQYGLKKSNKTYLAMCSNRCPFVLF